MTEEPQDKQCILFEQVSNYVQCVVSAAQQQTRRNLYLPSLTNNGVFTMYKLLFLILFKHMFYLCT